mmetsp:Transcript_47559/g.113205  ORF Transcript_47559/g.113205 Transcript_47559/m.113205 type:complete len:710 (-) Transcript_47559:283-2412(-)
MARSKVPAGHLGPEGASRAQRAGSEPRGGLVGPRRAFRARAGIPGPAARARADQPGGASVVSRLTRDCDVAHVHHGEAVDGQEADRRVGPLRVVHRHVLREVHVNGQVEAPCVGRLELHAARIELAGVLRQLTQVHRHAAPVLERKPLLQRLRERYVARWRVAVRVDHPDRRGRGRGRGLRDGRDRVLIVPDMDVGVAGVCGHDLRLGLVQHDRRVPAEASEGPEVARRVGVAALGALPLVGRVVKEHQFVSREASDAVQRDRVRRDCDQEGAVAGGDDRGGEPRPEDVQEERRRRVVEEYLAHAVRVRDEHRLPVVSERHTPRVREHVPHRDDPHRRHAPALPDGRDSPVVSADNAHAVLGKIGHHHQQPVRRDRHVVGRVEARTLRGPVPTEGDDAVPRARNADISRRLHIPSVRNDLPRANGDPADAVVVCIRDPEGVAVRGHGEAAGREEAGARADFVEGARAVPGAPGEHRHVAARHVHDQQRVPPQVGDDHVQPVRVHHDAPGLVERDRGVVDRLPRVVVDPVIAPVDDWGVFLDHAAKAEVAALLVVLGALLLRAPVPVEPGLPIFQIIPAVDGIAQLALPRRVGQCARLARAVALRLAPEGRDLERGARAARLLLRGGDGCGEVVEVAEEARRRRVQVLVRPSRAREAEVRLGDAQAVSEARRGDSDAPRVRGEAVVLVEQRQLREEDAGRAHQRRHEPRG